MAPDEVGMLELQDEQPRRGGGRDQVGCRHVGMARPRVPNQTGQAFIAARDDRLGRLASQRVH
jgi:hypothetical protein